jgi:hypothetical protein
MRDKRMRKGQGGMIREGMERTMGEMGIEIEEEEKRRTNQVEGYKVFDRYSLI